MKKRWEQAVQDAADEWLKAIATDAAIVDLEKHDAKYHPDGYKEGDGCKYRERLEKADLFDLANLNPEEVEGEEVQRKSEKVKVEGEGSTASVQQQGGKEKPVYWDRIVQKREREAAEKKRQPQLDFRSAEERRKDYLTQMEAWLATVPESILSKKMREWEDGKHEDEYALLEKEIRKRFDKHFDSLGEQA